MKQITNKYQTKEQNTLCKQLGEIREHLSNAVIIGLSNFFGVELQLKVPLLQKEPKALHNLIVEKASICEDFAQPSLGSTRIEKRNRSNKIFNFLSQFITEKMKEIVKMMNEKEEKLKFETTRNRSTKNAEKLTIFTSFEPFNENGMEMFGKKIIEIVTQKSEKIYMNKNQAIVQLNGCNEEIGNAFWEVINDEKCVTETKNILMNYFVYSYNQMNQNEIIQNVNQTEMIYSNMYSQLPTINTEDKMQMYFNQINQNDETKQEMNCNYNWNEMNSCYPQQQMWIDQSTGQIYQLINGNTYL